MGTIATAHGLCYCMGPWRNSLRVAPRMLDRAHISTGECDQGRKPEWLRRKDAGLLRAKELER